MATYPNNSTSLYLQVENTGREKKKKPGISCEIISASKQQPSVWSQVNGLTPGTQRDTKEGREGGTRRRDALPLVEEEDVRGSHNGHDPDQPAHVARPGAQLPQHQPDGAQQDTHCLSRVGGGGAGGRYAHGMCVSLVTHQGEKEAAMKK